MLIILNLCNNFNSRSNHLLKQNQEWECQLMVGKKEERKMIDIQLLLFFLALNLVCLIRLKILLLKTQIENKRYRVNKMIITPFWNHLWVALFRMKIFLKWKKMLKLSRPRFVWRIFKKILLLGLWMLWSWLL